MDKARIWVPADAANLHRTRGLHRIFEPRAKVDVESATVKVLAVVGYPELVKQCKKNEENGADEQAQ